MSFDALMQKVKQAESALEAQERATAANWRQFKSSWRAAWTPGRIVIAGLVSGFLVGKARPLARVSGGGALQMITALSSLFASGSAQAAADEAGDAAEHAEDTAEAAGTPATALKQTAESAAPSHEQPADYRPR